MLFAVFISRSLSQFHDDQIHANFISIDFLLSFNTTQYHIDNKLRLIKDHDKLTSSFIIPIDFGSKAIVRVRP